MSPKGDSGQQVMDLVTQLEGKCKYKNAYLEEIGRVFGVKVEHTNLGSLLDHIQKTVREMMKDRDDWQKKTMILLAIGNRNPIPVIVGLVVGGGLGFWLGRVL